MKPTLFTKDIQAAENKITAYQSRKAIKLGVQINVNKDLSEAKIEDPKK